MLWLLILEILVKLYLVIWSIRGFDVTLAIACFYTFLAILSGMLFYILKLLGMFRVNIKQERNGLDVEHHEIAYPETVA